jgi:hypothetical protein
MRDRLNALLSNKTNLILIAALVMILGVTVVGYNKIFNRQSQAIPEVDLAFDPDGPYAILKPRNDGNALVLNIKRVAEYQSISYDLEYQSNGIDRGVHGDLKKESGEKKSEYSQEILFGTCSQGYTSGTAHCVFDPNVENGTLTLHIRKEKVAYRMIVAWHMQKPDVALGTITSGDGHFVYKTKAPREDLVILAYTIVNDLSGVPKLPQDRDVSGKVYAFNVPNTKSFPKGEVTIELASNPGNDAKIGRFTESLGNWTLLDTKSASSSSTFQASAEGDGIFAVLVSKPK